MLAEEAAAAAGTSIKSSPTRLSYTVCTGSKTSISTGSVYMLHKCDADVHSSCCAAAQRGGNNLLSTSARHQW
jgi:hypothetical protein